jgi:hypothetical protein
MKKNMTREEILDKHNNDTTNNEVLWEDALNAMQEYADQEVEKIIEIYKFNNTNTN